MTLAEQVTAGGDGDIGLAEATRLAARVAELMPAPLAALFDAPFVRSSHLYEEFVDRLAIQVVRAAGLDAAARPAGSVEEIAARAGLALDRARLPLDWLLRRLAGRGVLDLAGTGDGPERFRAPDRLPDLDPAPVREAQRRHDPSWLPSYALAETTARDYPRFLRGDATGEEILFSPARFRLWLDYFSNDNGLYAVNNHVGAIALEEWLPRTPGVVLELGGGLASAAIAVLERFQRAGRLAELREYRFTEIVPAFLRRGQQSLRARFPDAGWLGFGSLDMNRPFEDQGVAPASLAAVYAVNTLHVAHDLVATASQVLRALEPGGRLVVSECVRPVPGQSIYAEFVFNLMETFRSPRLHPEYRPNGGFLTPEQWTAALEAAGFVDVRLLPDIARIRSRLPGCYVAAIGATRPR
jgi:SAM-dependent methyltransferase